MFDVDDPLGLWILTISVAFNDITFIVLAVLGLLVAYALYQHENAVERNVHQELLRDHGNGFPASCVRSATVYATPSIVTSSYRCTSEDGVQVAAVQVQQPFGLTAFKGKHLSAMVAEESR